MHEYSLVEALLERVDAEARRREAVSVHRIRVRIGELSGVEIELFEHAFEMARTATLSAGARLEVVPVAAAWSCSRCNRQMARGQSLRCPDCEAPARLTEGGEILLEQIEMEVH